MPNMHSIPTRTGTGFTGYVAPAKSGKGPGIVMIQEIFGVNPSMREIADRFADAGYTVLVPDLFWRMQTNVELRYEGKDLEKAYEYYHKFDVNQSILDLSDAVDFLRSHPACNGKVATLGFCLGGKMAYLTAAHQKVNAVVAFYGGGIAEHLTEGKDIHCPMLMFFGAEDEMIPANQVDDIKAAFANRPEVEIVVYPHVGHAFFNHARVQYNPAAAQLAYTRTIEFLSKAL